MVCILFNINRSRYYAHCQKEKAIDIDRLQLRAKVSECHRLSRGAAGSRSLVAMMAIQGIKIGRFKVRRLMVEAQVISKQPGKHKYKIALDERLDIANKLDRNFTTQQANRVWCGDITYIWAGGRWIYLAVILDLYTRRIVGWSLSDKPNATLVINHLNMLINSVASLKGYYSIQIRVVNIPAYGLDNSSGVIKFTKV